MVPNVARVLFYLIYCQSTVLHVSDLYLYSNYYDYYLC